MSSLSISAEYLLANSFSILPSKEMDVGCSLFSWSYATDIYFVLFFSLLKVARYNESFVQIRVVNCVI